MFHPSSQSELINPVRFAVSLNFLCFFDRCNPGAPFIQLFWLFLFFFSIIQNIWWQNRVVYFSFVNHRWHISAVVLLLR